MMRTLFLTAGLVLFVYVSLRLGPGRIAASLAEIGWGYVPIVAIAAAYQAARTAALAQCALLRPLAYPSLFAIRLSGQALQTLTFTGPFLAEPAKAWLIKRRGVPTPDAFAGIIAEYLVYTFISAGLSITGITWIRARVTLPDAIDGAAHAIVIVMAAFLAISAAAIAFRVHLLGAIVRGARHLPVAGRRIRIAPEDMRRLEDQLLGVLRDRPGEHLRIAALDGLAHVLLVTEAWWILRALDTGVGPVYALAIEGATKFASLAFFFIPAQVGATEALNAVVFSALALPPAGGFALAFVRRLRTLIVAGVGLAALSTVSRTT